MSNGFKNKRPCRILAAHLDYLPKIVYTESAKKFIKKGGKNEKTFMYYSGVSSAVFSCGL